MLFTIVEDFGKTLGESWSSYLEWRGIPFEHFDSLDGILRPSLFTPETAEDWDHVVHEDFMISYITDLTYARKVHSSLGTGSIVGFSYSDHEETNEGFLGYEIIDGSCNVSLITNWGNDFEIVNQALAPNALVPTLSQIENIHRHLLANHGDDNHVMGCRIISVYSTAHMPDALQETLAGKTPITPH
jgi:hypothetical protein